MDARAIIAKVRRGIAPSTEEIKWFANGLATRAVSDAQAGAFAMAVCLKGLSEEGRVALTCGMRDSGDVMKWDLPGPVLDKHSTGGVGDPVSLILAPALAACDVFVPMVSGRGLGHTGGTLDKLESILGLNTALTPAEFRQVTRDVGCAIVSATRTIAPADKRLYAIRDVTATVESVDLICASILSKKLAAGLDGLVLDVKAGSGAFMKTPDEAAVLARALVSTANGAGTPTAAFITDMSQPLAPSLGNALEVATCLEVLSGNRAAAPRLHDLTVALCARVLALSGHSEGEAEERVTAAISSGHAMVCFAAMIRAMGGPPDIAEDWHTHLPKAPVVGDVPAPSSGMITAIDGEALGLAVVQMGGGRQVESDRIDPRVGLSDVLPLGTKVSRGDPLVTIHAADEESAEAAARTVQNAITIGQAVEAPDLILERIEQ
ncbi:thymidine phosphorylase [Octadecabacter sp. 1_MG-2023]|uniref:thymidine phosphorylase n=1 Tax=unclassified Octadecabacter TaxID=196158 RepID=UPI001C081B7E|nr:MULTISPECIES: thymidine phosphorylase [unclassified Octadecabacter]MBU2994722.1 thymidine phosphorylase [Octadecabacter sp. B2R22]MDO6733984.1 thymidine phosphorylase [Octadecabacter sp. 1_MG-2023]